MDVLRRTLVRWCRLLLCSRSVPARARMWVAQGWAYFVVAPIAVQLDASKKLKHEACSGFRLDIGSL
jgi:hypothetical protein